MLSLDTSIVETDIEHIRMFKDLKVFLLEGFSEDRVVIKVDAIHGPQLKSANVAIKAIQHNARHKILNAAEISELRKFMASFDRLTADYKRFGLDYHASEKDAVDSLKQSIDFGFPFIKMRAVDVQDLEGAVKRALAGDKSDLKSFRDALKAPGGLEKLGQIVAADMFNGNTDRFFPTFKHYSTTNAKAKKKEHSIGGVAINARVLVNVGNVFRQKISGEAVIGALDFVDPQSGFKNIDQALSDVETAERRWPGRLLANSKERKEFAQDIIHDLEKFLSPKKKIHNALNAKLGLDADRRIYKGMVEGAILIKKRMEAKYNPNRWTAGSKQRYAVLATIKTA